MKRFALLLCTASLMACATEPSGEFTTDMSVPAVPPAFETTPVISSDDAADDPAILYNSANPAASIILGTNKRGGLYTYDLDGEVTQYLEVGNLNNVDVRQGVTLGDWSGDFVSATNRSDNSVSVFEARDGIVTFLGGFPVIRDEPYGHCAGVIDGQIYAIVTHKGGEVDLYRVENMAKGAASGTHLQTVKMASQLEGCVFDEANATLFIGEEEAGISRFALTTDIDGSPRIGAEQRVDVIGSGSGIAMDVEGLSVYLAESTSGYLIASSQGNNTYAVYNRETDAFLGRFRIGDSADGAIDGAQETDGLDVIAKPLPGFPKGVLIVQDGFNKPDGENQNFKIIDWVQIEKALGL